MGEPFFNIPLTQVRMYNCLHVTEMTCDTYIYLYMNIQVCPPGLHISLGIFQKIFDSLEKACHQLDIKIAANAEAQIPTTASAKYRSYFEANNEIYRKEEEATQHDKVAATLQQLLTWRHLSCNESTYPVLERMKEQTIQSQKAAVKLVSICNLSSLVRFNIWKSPEWLRSSIIELMVQSLTQSSQ